MDTGLMIAIAGVAAGVVLLAVGIPMMLRDTRRRQARGAGSLSGVGSGFDAVWRPSSEDAHARWEAQVEMPAPAPVPGDKGRVRDGHITIELAD